MSPVKIKRAYRSPRRAKQAEATRAAILDTADRMFRAEGWIASTIVAIARDAGISPETIYAHFKNKRAIAQELIIRATRGSQPDTPMMQQEHRTRMLGLGDAGLIIDAFAADISQVLTRGAPILAVVRSAAETDPEMAELYADLHRSRARNFGTLIAALERLGALREEVDGEAALGTVWSITSPELWLLRLGLFGATPQTNEDWIRTSLRRLLLA